MFFSDRHVEVHHHALRGEPARHRRLARREEGHLVLHQELARQGHPESRGGQVCGE